MRLQICGECMILIINYQKIKDEIIGKKNAKTTQIVLIAKFTKGNKNLRLFKDPFGIISSN